MSADPIGEWRDFFTYVGVVAGGLTGLIFVALSLQISEVKARRPAYVARAQTTLGALTGVLILSGLVLIPGQTPRALAIESLILSVALIADIARTVRSFEAPGERFERAVAVRTSLALLLLSLGAVGSIGLFVGADWSMGVLGYSTLLSLPLRLIQAWALLVAALPIQHGDQAEPETAHADPNRGRTAR